jgi:hypothetical protein
MKRKILIISVGLFLLLQFIPINRDNPPVEADINAEPIVKSILKKSCYDCHSNETKYPIYSYIFPVSVFLRHHVEEGREELNFSNWENLSTTKKISKADDIVDELEEGEMPLFSYTIFHRDAKLTKEEIQIIKKWAESLENKDESR